jgi:hypothetical protein
VSTSRRSGSWRSEPRNRGRQQQFPSSAPGLSNQLRAPHDDGIGAIAAAFPRGVSKRRLFMANSTLPSGRPVYLAATLPPAGNFGIGPAFFLIDARRYWLNDVAT